MSPHKPLLSNHSSSCHVSSSSAWLCQSAFVVAEHNLRTEVRLTASQSAQRVFFVFFIQLQIKVLWDNATFIVCLWFPRETTAALCRELAQRNSVWDCATTQFQSHICCIRVMWIWTNWSETDLIHSQLFGVADWSDNMNKFYSMQAVEPENGTNFRETFKFVSDVKRDLRKDGGEERSEPSCCLSVSKISYTVR